LGTVHGLKSEGERVRAAFDDVHPNCLAVGIPKEDIETLKACTSGEIDFEPSEYQIRYFNCLTTFGEVRIPPADLVAAYLLAEEYNVPLETLDLGDEQYAQLFTKNISILGLLRSSRKNKKAWKQEFLAENPEAFAIEWDKFINASKQFKTIEKERERHMAERLFEVAKQYDRILAVLPYPRFDGILEYLSTLKKHKK
jgi:pheromone shutdown protein TraB